MIANRHTQWIVGLVAGAVLVVLAGLLTHHWMARLDPAVEVGVFFPVSSDRNWCDFVEGVRLAANEADAVFRESADVYACSVQIPGMTIQFRWYPEAGARGLQRRVTEVCRQSHPPIALVGANNSTMTQPLARALAAANAERESPLLLMTTATTDDLIHLHPGRSFRFGFNNSTQARVVLDRLAQYYEEQGISKPRVRGITVHAADDPFSIDLAKKFSLGLHRRFQAEPTLTLTLATSTGNFDEPSADERLLADEIVRRMVEDPDKQWVVALPVGSAVYRRVSFAIHEAFRHFTERQAAEKASRQLVILMGDTLNYYSFAEWQLNQFLPEETPAPVIFFAHANPIDPTVATVPDRKTPARNLNRELARTLLDVLPKVGPRGTPGQLAQALANYQPEGAAAPMFADGERREGGHAIVAIPRPEAQRFELLLPSQWQSTAPRR